MSGHFDHLIRGSVEADIKSGDAASRCRYRFKEIAPGVNGWHRHEFASIVAAYCSIDLGAKDRDGVLIRWFEPAEGEKDVDYGSDSWNGFGFMEPSTGDVWLRHDIPNHSLVDIVAHETCHAIKHRHHSVVSEDAEREAYEYGHAMAEKMRIPRDSLADLYVVKDRSHLPLKAHPCSAAICWEPTLALYVASHRGTLRSPRWFEQYDFRRGEAEQ